MKRYSIQAKKVLWLLTLALLAAFVLMWMTSPVAGVRWTPSDAPVLPLEGGNLALACPPVLGLSGKVVGLAPWGGEFLVATRDPNALWAVAPHRMVRLVKKLTAAPTALAVLGPDAAIVGFEGKGVFRYLVSTGKMEALRSSDGEAILRPSAVSVASDGSFAIAEGSRRFQAGWPYDFLDGRPNGRVFVGRSNSNEVERLPGDFYFSSGLSFDENGRALLVAETFRYRIRRFERGADGRYVEAALVASNLPIMPYSIEKAGGNWFLSGSIRNNSLDVIQNSSVLRRLAAQLPDQLLKSLPTQQATRHAVIAQLSNNGMRMRFKDFSGSIYGVSVFQIRSDKLLFGSFYLNGLRVAHINSKFETKNCKTN